MIKQPERAAKHSPPSRGWRGGVAVVTIHAIEKGNCDVYILECKVC
jgi:hypothetical protein